jgi:hypothetical protein
MQFVDGSAFGDTKLHSVLIEMGSNISRVEHEFLLDIEIPGTIFFLGSLSYDPGPLG